MAAEISLYLLIRKLNYLLDEMQIIIHPGLRSQIRGSIQELYNLQRYLKDAEKKTNDEQQRLISSIQVLHYVYPLEDDVDEFLLKTYSLKKWRNFAFFKYAWNQLLFNIKMEKHVSCFDPELMNIIERLWRDVGIQSQLTESASERSEHSQRWETIASFAEEADDVVGLEDQIEELMKFVFSSRRLPALTVIPVIGEAGSGKTTLVRFIYNNPKVKQHFKCCAWISVSETFEEGDVLIDILRQVSVVRKEEMLPWKALRGRVPDLLYPYLIVLDDIPSSSVWENLESVFPISKYGNKVILTMRSTNVTRSFDPWVQLLHIRPLNPEESWTLFLKKVQRAEDSLISSGLMNLKEKILSKCGGLPLSIVTLGGLLSTKPLSYPIWASVIDSDTSTEDHHSSLNTLPVSHRDVPSSLNILAVSYRDLPSSVKACLLYLLIFPKSHDIPIRRLFRLWLAEGLGTPMAGERNAPEDLVEGYFEALVRRNMIVVTKWRLDGSPKTCRVQPALYDSLLPTAADMGFFHVHRNLNYTEKPQFNVRRIAAYLDIRSYPSHPCYIQSLRSYISFNTCKDDTPANEVDKLLKKIIGKRGFGLLTVLDLENVYKPVLSETLGKLLHLKYLGLRWTFLDSVPESIGRLPCLETLDVKHTNIPTLPISIWKAKKLRHLYMNEIPFDMSTEKSSIKVSSANLQTLCGLLVGNNSSVILWLRKLTSLRKLGLTCLESSVEEIIHWVSGMKNLQSLRLRSINEFSEPSVLNLWTLKEHLKLNDLHLFGKLPNSFYLNELPPNLRILTLSVSELEQDPMPILGSLPHLNILRLFARSHLSNEMKSLRGGFPELRVLKLWMLEELEEWTLEEGSMPKLRELEIRCCTKLKRASGLQQLAALKELTLTNMPQEFLEEIRANMSPNVLFTSRNWDFPPLQK